MNFFNIYSIEAVACKANIKYKYLMCHGHSIFFLDQCSPKVFRYSVNLEYIEEYHTSRTYTAICYDPEENCFWGCCKRDGAAIYKMNESFMEIDCFRYENYRSGHGNITAISYDEREKNFILTYGHTVLEVSKKSQCNSGFKFSDVKCTYRDCQQSYNHCYCAEERNGSGFLFIYKNSRLIMQTCLPAEYKILSIAQVKEENKTCIYILASKQECYSYIIKGQLCSVDEKSCQCSNRKHSEAQCHLHKECADIIESIALEQTAIAHILNAEGEKIQKAVAITDNIQDLIEVNQSALQMVSKLTLLEEELCSKLKITCSYCTEQLNHAPFPGTYNNVRCRDTTPVIQTCEGRS